jgi:hypothetical protein
MLECFQRCDRQRLPPLSPPLLPLLGKALLRMRSWARLELELKLTLEMYATQALDVR